MPPQFEEIVDEQPISERKRILVRRGTSSSSDLIWPRQASMLGLYLPTTPVSSRPSSVVSTPRRPSFSSPLGEKFAVEDLPLPLATGGKSSRSNGVASSPAGQRNLPKADYVTSRSGSSNNIAHIAKRVNACMDGSAAVSHVAYTLSDLLFLYPVTPAGFLGEEALQWGESERQNAFHAATKVTKLHTRTGAGGTVYGAMLTGEIATLCASTSSLPSLTPTLYRIAKSGLPSVVHAAAQSFDDDLSLIVSHDDVMSVRNTGYTILASNDAQEAHDLAVISHLVAIQYNLPVLHVFDSCTSSQVREVEILSRSSLGRIVNPEIVDKLRKRLDNQASTNNKHSYRDFAAVHNISQLMEDLAKSFGRTYKPFEYYGAPDAEHVVVVMGSAATIVEEVVDYLSLLKKKVGVLKIRLFRPWSAEHFVKVLPKTVKKIVVLDRCSEDSAGANPLFNDIQSTILSQHWSKYKPLVVGGRYGLGPDGFTPQMASAVFAYLESPEVAHGFHVGFVDEDSDSFELPVHSAPLLHAFTKEAIIWDAVTTDIKHVTSHKNFLKAIAEKSPVKVAASFSFDSTKPIIAAQSQIRLGAHQLPARQYDIVEADYVACHSVELLEYFDVVSSLKSGGTFLLNAESPGDETTVSLPDEIVNQLIEKRAVVYVVDAQKVKDEQKLESVEQVLHLAFVKLTQPFDYRIGAVILSTAEQDLLNVADAVAASINILPLASLVVEKGVEVTERSEDELVEEDKEKVVAAEEAAEKEDEVENRKFVANILPRILPGSSLLAPPAQTSRAATEYEAAMNLIFPDAFETQFAPKAGVTALLKVTKWERVTPLDYDRNVFHIEFDTTGTGLTYQIGEALAVYGHNDEREVEDFLHHYGLNTNELVLLRDTKARGNKGELMSVGQLFTQVLDIFGRPTKKFYEALAQAATDDKEKEKLQFLISAEGKDELQKNIDETITYADLLRTFRSAHLSLEALTEIVGRIKARHYSIASSMKMNPNSVHLLIVVHDWVTPSGKHKIGQCTRYLSNIREGATVAASVCSSVMKLPKDHKDPIIMAGLGTGMAPFRAFIQERAFFKSQGVEVGPITLYFGSRYQAKEYLYGEEMEKYHKEGLLTNLRTAFSRDQKEKIYIQHRMQQDRDLLGQYMVQENGHFYLCGPTWPASDVRAAMVDALVAGGMQRDDASGHIEDMKNSGRYVLEVY